MYYIIYYIIYAIAFKVLYRQHSARAEVFRSKLLETETRVILLSVFSDGSTRADTTMAWASLWSDGNFAWLITESVTIWSVHHAFAVATCCTSGHQGL
jgi:hypothetical protein